MMEELQPINLGNQVGSLPHIPVQPSPTTQQPLDLLTISELLMCHTWFTRVGNLLCSINMIDLQSGQASKNSYPIHHGYLCLPDSLEADIKHAEVNTVMSVVFQQAYTKQIINKLVNQLPEPGALGALQSQWCSSVLNQILQHQLSGFSSYNPHRIEKHFRTLSFQDQELFYLQNDPLDCNIQIQGDL